MTSTIRPQPGRGDVPPAGPRRPAAPAGGGAAPFRFGHYAAAIGAVTLLAGAALVAVWRATVPPGAGPGPWLPVLLAAAAVWAVGAGTAVVDRLAVRLVTPRALPRLALPDGIPARAHCLVAVVGVVRDAGDVERLTAVLRCHRLATAERHVTHALLTDFPDAGSPELDGEDALLDALVRGVNRLNDDFATGAGGDGGPFLLLHRRRTYNRSQGVWMGWERKRGKLAALNRAILGRGGDRPFATTAGALGRLRRVRFVVVLDEDSVLRPGAVTALVATMSHPANRARYDAGRGRVARGYGILQPSLEVTSGPAGRPPGDRGYAAYGSGCDAHQRLFGEGAFLGKGIYDVAVYHRALDRMLPVDRVLSHDLLEGSYCRTGVVADAVVAEPEPSHYLHDVARRVRWVRGDWQNASWILPAVPTAGGRRRNPLSAVARWNLADRLLRSLRAPLALALAVAAVAEPQVLLTPFVIACAIVVAAPASWGLLEDVLARFRRSPSASAPAPAPAPAPVAAALRRVRADVLGLAVMPYEAVTYLTAIVRTLWRLVRRRLLLDWRTSREHERSGPPRLGRTVGRMWPGPALGLAVVVTAARTTSLTDGAGLGVRLGVGVAALAVGVLWTSGPLLVHRAGETRRRPAALTVAPRTRTPRGRAAGRAGAGSPRGRSSRAAGPSR